VLATATKPVTAATMVRILSSVLTVAAEEVTGADMRLGMAGWRCATGAAVAVRGGGADGLGAAGAAAGAAEGRGIPPAPLGPPGGRVGNFIVGAAEGFGGRLMRTVSFLGWTLPVSFFGGTAPAGMFGIFSAIKILGKDKTRVGRVKLYRKEKPDW
jgi:hypothetical protein